MKKKKTLQMSLGVLLAIVYFAGYLTRKNFDALIVELVEAEGIEKTALSLISTGLFISYAVGQLVSGWLGDKIPPQRLIVEGLLLSAAMNFAMPFAIGAKIIWLAIICWCINGFAQAMLWPPIVRILAMNCDSDGYNKGTVTVSKGGTAATILIYLLAPVCISLSGWRLIFFFAAGFTVVVALFFRKSYASLSQTLPQMISAQTEKKNQKGKIPGFALLMAIILPAIIMQGILRDGVTTWMPSYINETFNLGTRISILSGILLPIFTLFCYSLTLKIQKRWFHDEFSCSAFIFGISLTCSLLMYFFNAWSAIASVLLLTLLVGCMHGINILLVCIVPKHFAYTGRVAMISGVLNFATYVGSALSGYGFAALADSFGWQGTILSWVIVSAVGAALCLIGIRPWKAMKKCD